MTPETFFANFGYLADAPNGVQKLREMILQLAVQGKLVPQDPSDEPASVLLAKIEAVRAVLVQSGILKKSKGVDCGSVDSREDMPDSWLPVRLGQLTHIRTGKLDANASSSNGEYPFFTCARDPLKINRFAYDCECVLLAGNGNFDVNYYYGKFEAYQRTYIIEPVDRELLNARYLHRFIQIHADHLRQISIGGVIQYIKIGFLTEAIFPLPPLEEQKRIVAKVDQLMALCDELEARQQRQQQGRVRLNSAALDALLTAREPDEFADHWQRISTNFDLLYDHPETIAKLRAAILQLAVQGKLVPQDTNDEPASVLLERIRKQTPVKRAKIYIPPKDEPFELSAGWVWVQLGDLGHFVGGGTPSKQNPSFWVGNIPWVSPKDMKTKFICDAIDHISPEAVQKSATKIIPVGSILMVLRGMILLHSFPVAKTIRQVTINQDMKALVCSLPELSDYVLIARDGEKPRILNKVERSSHGTCRIDSEDISSFVIGLPPLKEQKRIVAKVDQLMALCDELEARLNQAQQQGEKLMEATVRQFLGTSAPQKPHTRVAKASAVSKLARPARYASQSAPATSELLAAEAPTAYGTSIPDAILAAMQLGQEYSRADILAATGIREADWMWAIKQLREQGRVMQTGEKRGARYRLK